MNNIEIPSSIAYMILYPNMAVTRTSEGHIVVLAHNDKPGYVEVKHFEQMERDGVITIHNRHANGVAQALGRTAIHYTIN